MNDYAYSRQNRFAPNTDCVLYQGVNIKKKMSGKGGIVFFLLSPTRQSPASQNLSFREICWLEAAASAEFSVLHGKRADLVTLCMPLQI